MSNHLSEAFRTPRNPRTKEVTSNHPRIPRSQATTDRIAQQLVDKFNSPDHRPFFLRIAWRFSEDTIMKNVATAFELGKNPRAYFIALMKRENGYHG